MTPDRLARVKAALKHNLLLLAGEWDERDGSYERILIEICDELERDLVDELRRRRHLAVVPSGDEER